VKSRFMDKMVQIIRLVAGLLGLLMMQNGWTADSDRAKASSAASQPASTNQPADLATLRKKIEDYRALNRRMDESLKQKSVLEAQLNQAKKNQGGRGFFKNREIELLQTQLHTVTDGLVGMGKQQKSMAESFIKDVPRWRAALARRLDDLEQMRSAAGRGAVKNNLQIETAEIIRRIALLDGLGADMQKTYTMEAWQGRNKNAMFPPRQQFPIMGALIQRPGIDAQIENIEREQEILQKIMRRNEQALQRLRSMQMLQQDSSELGGVELSESIFENNSAPERGTRKPVFP